ncbi:SLC13 family permease [Pseudahrensia aquimaris]|uniref:SLC13 family permease n=1 Tax=Pseudahrensia aquimaris TaxID=744461 RepID=A0ABW3FCJ6_9HYPH
MDNLHMWLTFVVIACTIIAFASERWSIEGISLATIAVLLAIFTLIPQPTDRETISAPELLIGFANPALITVLALLVIGQALFNTDALERPAQMLSQLGGSSAKRTIFVLLVSAGITSAFLNNTPVVVMFIPIVVAIAAQRNFAASSALMPLSYVGILGGMTTLIGSSTNLLVAGVAERYDIVIGFFDFTIPGLVLAGAGLLYVLFVMPLILRKDDGAEAKSDTSGRQFLAQIDVSIGHALEGEASVHGLFPSLSEITVRSVYRNSEMILPPFEDVVLQAGDIVVVAATRRSLTKALSQGAASLPEMREEEIDPARSTDIMRSIRQEFTLAEAVVAPGSRFAGRTIEASRIRRTFGTMVLGVQRRSGMARGLMRQTRLEPGDTLLVGGLPDDLENLRSSRELLLLERSMSEIPLRAKAPRAIGIFAMVIIAASIGLVPIVAASLIGAYAVIASGCLSIRQAARSFDKQIFMMVGASLAAATAMERTGGAAYLADGVVSAMDGQSPGFILSALFLVTALLTNVLSNNATAVLFTPIAIGIALKLGVPVEPFIVCIIFAANCSFATPVGYQTNLLVLGPGRYRFIDYVKAGLPLLFLLWIVFTLFAPTYYGL